jgi:hypothetical protein
MDKIRQVLERYLPPGTAAILTDWVVEYRIHLHIKRDRRSKAGDYRCPIPGDPRHRISINHNLNPYAFLITLVHEFAHRIAFEKYDRRNAPHGKEWKQEFQKLMVHFFKMQVFPPELNQAVYRYMLNPAASTGSDRELSRLLMAWDPAKPDQLVLDEVPEGVLFSLGDKRIFRKGALRRTRYLCLCVNNNKNYLVDRLAEVVRVDED